MVFYRSVDLFFPLSSLLCSTVRAELPQTCGVYRSSGIAAHCDPSDESSCMALEASEEQVRTSGSWASFADRTSCTGCRPFAAPASAQNNTNTERPCLQWGSILRPHSSRGKSLHLRTRDHHNRWFRASRSYCLVNIRYVEQYLVIMVIMIINTIISV